MADDLSRVGDIPRNHIQVIYNPVITPGLREKASAPLTDAWLADSGPPVILAVGSLREQKGFDVLIKAFAEVRRTRAARLLILGEGVDRPQLEALIKELSLQNDVRLPGFVLNPYAYMARASLFVLSSNWEGLPTVLVEALFCGVPVIATDCHSGPREILGNGRFGRLVPVGDRRPGCGNYSRSRHEIICTGVQLAALSASGCSRPLPQHPPEGLRDGAGGICFLPAPGLHHPMGECHHSGRMGNSGRSFWA